MNNLSFIIASILLVGGLLALIPQIIWLVLKVIGYFTHFSIAYRPFGITAIVLASVWILLVIYGNTIGRFRYEVKEQKIKLSDLPKGFDGYRIVHISDLHLDSWHNHKKRLQKIVNEINALQPDIICFTGDLVSMAPEEIDQYKDILVGMKAKEGIFSILGNHDYIPYNKNLTKNERIWAIERVINSEREELKWNLLINENRIIHHNNDSIAILGCENHSVGFLNSIQRADMLKTAKGTKGLFKILLTHDPSHWQKDIVKKTDIRLTLSGHTHAMQVRLFNVTPSKLFYPECDGLYKEGNQYLYVNIGLGGTVPLRIGATPEITLITLCR